MLGEKELQAFADMFFGEDEMAEISVIPAKGRFLVFSYPIYAEDDFDINAVDETKYIFETDTHHLVLNRQDREEQELFNRKILGYRMKIQKTDAAI